MSNTLRNLRDAVLGRGTRRIEVTDDGTIRESDPRESPKEEEMVDPPRRKPTKLADRTFGFSLYSEAENRGDRDGVSQEIERLVLSLQLNDHMQVLVPTQDRQGQPLPDRDIAAEVEKVLAIIAGGATTFQGRGIWLNEAGDFIREVVYLVQCYFSRILTAQNRQQLQDCLVRFVIEYDQESLAVVVNGRLHLLGADLDDLRVVAV